MPDVDVKSTSGILLSHGTGRTFGANFPYGVGGLALSLNFSSCFCSLTVSLYQSFIYEVTPSHSSARRSLLLRASRSR
jgi:hypothetical protein